MRLIILINILHSKGLWGSVRNVDIKKIEFFNVLTKNLALQMRDCHFGNVLESCVPLWFMFQQDIQILFD
jgi:hypothetical protein